MAKPKIALYVDIVSPFSYMAYWTTRHSPILSNVEISYIPMFLGGLMKACDNRPPLDIRNKDKWIDVERLRWSSAFKIPMTKTTPEGFPVLTLQTMRAMCALQILDESKLPLALDALYESFWVQANSAVGKPDGFELILDKAIGKELTGKVMKDMNGKDAKARLMSNTDLAFNNGAFGLPWWQCTNTEGKTESFWGFDHFGQVAEFLGLDRSGQEGMRAML
jgi:2-hydroxychromene-2-carboxylate isomerase